jgi:hypothetical protein
VNVGPQQQQQEKHSIRDCPLHLSWSLKIFLDFSEIERRKWEAEEGSNKGKKATQYILIALKTNSEFYP